MRGRLYSPSRPRRRHRRAAALRPEGLEARELLATFAVTSADDAGAGSLREAIIASNTTPGPDTIAFEIDSGLQTIALESALPQILETIEIDGTTQPGFDPENPQPLIELDGANAGAEASGLDLAADADGSTIRGLIVGGFEAGGIRVLSSGNTIAGNYIGLNAEGNAARANAGFGGVRIESADNTIGGATEADRNVISGNDGDGVSILDLGAAGATGNVILGNFIGTDASGSSAVSNTASGIDFTGSGGNTIGGTEPGAGNVISGNLGFGVELIGSGASDNLIVGNRIGTSADGLRAVANGEGGLFSLRSANTIGGTEPGAGNLISGNSGPGITLERNLTQGGQLVGSVVQGNLIGVDLGGQDGLPNAGAGILLNSSANLIGGETPEAGNTIAFTVGDDDAPGVGVRILSTNNRNRILSNAIFANDSLGIDLDQPTIGVEVLPNDPGDEDTSALDGVSNEGQNFPVLTSAETGGGVTIIRGGLNSRPNTTFRVQFFESELLDPTGFGEGRTLIADETFTTDGSGNVNFELILDGERAGTPFLTATATDPDGNSSEFSEGVQVLQQAAADLELSAAATPNPVTVGGELEIALTVSNTGPETGDSVLIEDRLPIGSAFLSADEGVVPDQDGILRFNIGALEPGEERTVRYRVRPSIVGTIANDASVRSDAIDSEPGSNTARIDILVEPTAGTSVFNFASETFQAVEGSGAATILITRTNGAEEASVLFETQAGTASSVSDFQSVSQVVTFEEGQVVQTVTVPLINNFEPEPAETILVRLSDPEGNARLGTTFEATVQVIDDDPNPPGSGFVRIGAPTFSVNEGAGTLTIPIERVGGSAGRVGARIRTLDGSAVAGEDFQAIDLDLSFANGDKAPKLVQIPIQDDGQVEDLEFFLIELSPPSDGGLTPADLGPNLATATITDNEVPPPPPEEQVLSFSQSTFEVAENGAFATIDVSRNSTAGEVRVTFEATAGTAAPGERFVPVTEELIFEEGEQTKLIQVPIINTTTFEGDETVEIRLLAPSGGASLGEPSEAVLTILDDEPAPPPPPPIVGQVTFAESGITVEETDGEAVIRLVRAGGSDGELTVLLVQGAGNAVPNGDFVPELFTITFADGQTTQEVALTVLDDTVMDGNRAVGLFLVDPQDPVGQPRIADPASIVLTILDDERDQTPPVVVDARFTGSVNSPSGIAVQFNEPLNPLVAQHPGNYTVTAAGPDGRFGTPDDQPIPIAATPYNLASSTTTIQTATPLQTGVTFRVTVSGAEVGGLADLFGNTLDGDGDGFAGGTYIADIARSFFHRFTDSDGDSVRLALFDGGTIDLVRRPDGEADIVRLVNPSPGRSTLLGDVQRRGSGDGQTTIRRLIGLDPFGLVRNRLTTPPFQIGEIVPEAVDALLARPASPLRGRAPFRRG